MKPSLCFLIFSILAPVVHLPAQTKPIDAAALSMDETVKFRAQLADSVGNGAMSTDEALLALQKQGKASGLELETAADLAYASIDLGQRLIAAHKPEAAEKVLRAAAESLAVLVKSIADIRAADKAQYLRRLAFVRSNYLNQAAQAALDLDQALVLQPKDVDLLLAKQNLANAPANIEALKPKN